MISFLPTGIIWESPIPEFFGEDLDDGNEDSFTQGQFESTKFSAETFSRKNQENCTNNLDSIDLRVVPERECTECMNASTSVSIVPRSQETSWLETKSHDEIKKRKLKQVTLFQALKKK